MPPQVPPAKQLKINDPDEMVDWHTRIPQWLYDKLGNVAKASSLDGRNHVVEELARTQLGGPENSS